MGERDKISITDTARWVAFYRAMESQRPDALFSDPYARTLAGPRGEEIVNKMKSGRTYAWPMIVRTRVMDELIMESLTHDGVDLVVNLAAGLDARPYRMDLSPQLTWVEVDFPQTIEYKTKILAAQTPRCRLERVGLDLADVAARRALFAQLNGKGQKTLVITEGLMTYLTPEQAGDLASDLAAQPNFASWMTDIVAPFIIRMMKRTWSKNLAATSAEFKFAPEDGAGFYARFGWRLRVYRAMVIDSHRYGREARSAWLWRLLFPRAIKAERTRRTGPMTGVILLERVG
jgi:methyltransferase (TIGR00027 family)